MHQPLFDAATDPASTLVVKPPRAADRSWEVRVNRMRISNLAAQSLRASNARWPEDAELQWLRRQNSRSSDTAENGSRFNGAEHDQRQLGRDRMGSHAPVQRERGGGELVDVDDAERRRGARHLLDPVRRVVERDEIERFFVAQLGPVADLLPVDLAQERLGFQEHHPTRAFGDDESAWASRISSHARPRAYGLTNARPEAGPLDGSRAATTGPGLRLDRLDEPEERDVEGGRAAPTSMFVLIRTPPSERSLRKFERKPSTSSKSTFRTSCCRG
jgi:hypothetical protein